MTANERQVGGQHYKTEYEHWDLAVIIPIHYLEATATKYVSRWRKKHGIEDLQKAGHYLDKLIEVADYKLERNLTKSEIGAEVNRYSLANGLTVLEEEFIVCLSTYETSIDLHHAQCILEEIITEAELEIAKRDSDPFYPGSPEDGGHHDER
jgi:hypothetical protein